jgi:hypothetical protein
VHRLPIPDDDGVALRSPSKRRHVEDLEGVGADSSEGSSVAHTSVPKRPRIGFAENVQVFDAGADIDTGEDVPPVGASEPRQPRIGFADDVQVLEDAGERSPSRSINVEYGDGNGARRVSLFGP